MNKTELVAAIAERQGISKKQAEENLVAMMETMAANLTQKGDKIILRGFGTFEVKESKERTGLNPQTKAKIQIPAKLNVKYKSGIEL
jgi:DNA-binding protein HU-beta